MKKITIFLMMILAITVDAQVNIANGLLAYYPYNGNANDESGNGYNGTVGTGVTLSTDRFGVQNKAYNFQNDAIVVSNIFYDLDSNYTITAWFNTSATNSNRLFLWSDNSVMLRKFTGSSLNRVSSSFVEGYFTTSETSCGINSNAAFLPSSASPNPYLNGQWHMLTLTRNNNLLSLYVDSVFIDDEIIVDNCSQFHGLLASEFQMGSFSSQFSTFIGKLDDVMIHNRVLNSSEISYLYNLSTSWSSTTSTDLISENKLTVFPNPSDELVNIRLIEYAKYSIKIFDVNGRTIFNNTYTGVDFQLNTMEWSKGIYLLKIADENGEIYTQKIMKE